MGPSGLTGTGQCKTQFVALVERYYQLGRLLPALDGIDTDDNVELAEFVAATKSRYRPHCWKAFSPGTLWLGRKNR
jgi:hypothetical protein